MTQHKLTSAAKNPASGWGRRFVLAQITVQIGMALTPFYASSVHAMLSEDNSAISGTASHASALGQATQSGNLRGLATQQAGGLATQEIQQWLQNFGTARVELGTSDNFSVKSGAVDLLLPLMKSEQRLFFTQGGVRNKDGQITGNFGLGQRHFISDWMLGYNAFYDHNMSRGHQRLGLGTEAWRDNLKLSGNTYYRLSSWKTSRDVEDYDERPANGFDLRAEAYLPAYPALGGKLMYEKYFGDEVGLFGSDKRQKNPDAVTAGVNYTPVPLVSVSADHKRGGSQSDTVFGLQMAYQLGESFLKQIDPGRVAERRSLAGSAMDLVERNNNIVLEYRKKQLVHFALPKEMTGTSLKTLDLSYTLTSKYPLARIFWNDAALVAAGGKTTDLGGGKYQLTLPAYQAGVSNVYPLSGVAVDSRNNASPVASTLVTVTAPVVSVANSGVTASPAIVAADGKTTSTITVTLIDEEGNALAGMAPELTATLSEALSQAVQAKSLPVTPARLGEAQETAAGSGVYTFVLTAGTRVGVATVTPSLAGIALKAVAVSEIADASSATFADGSLKVTTDNGVANGAAANRVDARVVDAGGNPLASVPVTFTLSGSAQVAGGGSLTVTSDADGNVSLQFTDTVAQTVNVKAVMPNGGSAAVDTLFKADASTASLQGSDLTADRVSALANGSDKIIFTALVKDAYGNPVPDLALSWTTSSGELGAASGKTDAAGKITVTLGNTLAGNAQVAAQLGAAAAVNAPEVNFSADGSTAGIGAGDLLVDKNSITAGGTDVATFTATVKDVQGNVLANQTVTWTKTLGDLNTVTSVTDANGVTQVTLSGLKSGVSQVTAAAGTAAATSAPQVSIIADKATAAIAGSDLIVNKNRLIANGNDQAIYSATVKDANGNLVEGIEVSWVTDLGDLKGSPSMTSASGVATIILSGTVMGTAQATAAVNGGAAVNAPQVNLSADSSTARIASLLPDVNTVTANGADVVTYTAVVQDAHGNLIPNLSVSWASNLGNYTGGSSSTTDDKGETKVTLSSLKSGAATATATPGTGSAGNASVVNFTADGSTAHIVAGSLRVDKNTVVANDTDLATYTALVKDANDNLVEGAVIGWTTDRGTLGASSTSTGADGQTTVTLKGTQAGAAQVVGTVNTAATNAPLVNLIADVTTAKVDSVVPDKTLIIGSGGERANLSATVTDAFGNPLVNVPVSWSTTLGDISGSSVTGSNGIALSTLTALHISTTNGTSHVTASISNSSGAGNVAVRAVLKVKNKYFWTLAERPTTAEATAKTYCQNYGGGTVGKRSDFESFYAEGLDFATMKVTGQFLDARYYLGGEWRNDLYADYHSATAAIGIRIDTKAPTNNGYICVK